MIPTFLIGLLSLMIWFFVTSADRTALRLFWKAVLYFLLGPLLLFPAYLVVGGLGLSDDPGWNVFWFVVITPIIEEALKLWASRTEAEGAHVFALIALFGVFELMLSKPFMMVSEPDKATAVLHSLQALPAVFLHLLTGAIYAFRWPTHRDRQFIICVCIHATWNAAVSRVAAPLLSECALLAGIPVFAMATVRASPRTISEWRRSWNAVPTS